MKNNYDGLFTNPEFENLLYESEFFMLIGIVGSEKLIGIAEQIISLIDKELDEKESWYNSLEKFVKD